MVVPALSDGADCSSAEVRIGIIKCAILQQWKGVVIVVPILDDSCDYSLGYRLELFNVRLSSNGNVSG